MFSSPKIFSQFPELVAYVCTRDFLLRPKQFHAEERELQENVRKLEAQFGLQKAFFLAQCQSSEISEITEKNEEEILFADACFTELQYISLNVVTADCIPILLYERKKKIVGVVHAGWRGSSERILEKTLQTLREQHACDMKDVFIFIGPSICTKCYEVGVEVAKLFPKSSSKIGERYFLDLRAENLRQALECGVLRQHIEISKECTFELPETYFSYRREKLKANFVSGIGVKELGN